MEMTKNDLDAYLEIDYTNFELCDRQYRQYFRLTKNQVAFILSTIRPILTYASKRNKTIIAEHQLLTTLN